MRTRSGSPCFSRQPGTPTILRPMLQSMLASMTLVACSPALDWREARMEAASGLRAMFPCRPHSQARRVPLAGHAVTLTLHVCETSGATFAVSHADVGDPARVGPSLQALREATQANLAANATLQTRAWQVPGMTPQPSGGRWTLSGRLPDGQAVFGEMAVFSRGTWVVQATLLGPVLDEAALQPFFDGLRFVD